MPSRKEESPSMWDTWYIENVFTNQVASSTTHYPQELNPWSSRIEEPHHSSTVEKNGRPERDQDLRCQSGPSAKNSVIFSGGDSSKNYGSRPTTTAVFRSSFRQIHHTSNFCLLEDKVQYRGMYLLTIFYGS